MVTVRCGGETIDNFESRRCSSSSTQGLGARALPLAPADLREASTNSPSRLLSLASDLGPPPAQSPRAFPLGPVLLGGARRTGPHTVPLRPCLLGQAHSPSGQLSLGAHATRTPPLACFLGHARPREIYSRARTPPWARFPRGREENGPAHSPPPALSPRSGARARAPS